MNPTCTGCGKPPHAGGCKLPASQPPAPSEATTRARRDYLQSDEFKRACEASLAGRRP